jgi:hypothetical protein
VSSHCSEARNPTIGAMKSGLIASTISLQTSQPEPNLGAAVCNWKPTLARQSWSSLYLREGQCS